MTKLIVALDGLVPWKAMALAAELADLDVVIFKVNDVLDDDPDVVARLPGPVMADTKYHDIPNTVANRVAKMSSRGPKFITVHASGGEEMMRAAVAAAGETKILAVTLLTSLNTMDCLEVYGTSEPRDVVWRLASLAKEAGVAGLVCSPAEVAELKCLDLVLVVPGIRPEWARVEGDDQSRVATPRQAADAGADYVVVGRPITRADDPVAAVKATLAELE